MSKLKTHKLPQASPGTNRELVSIHFGDSASGKKAYIQAGLHADEAPGYLVAGRLVDLLDDAEHRGDIRGEIVIVPAANPIGFSQWGTDTVQGRFDNSDHVNFNRRFNDLAEEISKKIAGQLSSKAEENVSLIRACAQKVLLQREPQTETAYLKNLLLMLSHDADIVLDLHCDYQALVHIYTGVPLWPDGADLAAQMGAGAVMVAEDSGDTPFDEANSKFWWKLAARYPQHPIPAACFAATVELRGVLETEPHHTEIDAQNLFVFLQRRGFVAGDPPDLPPLLAEATPLEAVDYVASRGAGIISFLKNPGDVVAAGDVIARVYSPLGNLQTGEPNAEVGVRDIVCRSSGVLFARSVDRFARPGKIIAKVAGKIPLVEKGNYLLTF